MVDEQALVRIRDMGSSFDFPNEPVFAVSPDGKKIAVQLRRADPSTNTYCLGMVIVDLARSRPPVLIDSGGDFIKWSFPDLLGKADFPTGMARVITPRWLGNRSIAFLKKTGSTVQVWEARVDGSASRPLTPDPLDIADFRVRDGGRTILYSTRRDARVMAAEHKAESLQGFRYDDRFFPVAQAQPYPRTPLAYSYFALDVATLKVRAASPAEQLEFDPGPHASADHARGSLWIKAAQAPFAATLATTLDDGRTYACADPACRGADHFFWLDSRREVVVFSRNEGWGQEDSGLYAWTPTSGRVRRIISDTALLLSCAPVAGKIGCAREESDQPRRLVAIDPKTGALNPIFDPNPEFAQLQHGYVQRLRWRYASHEIFGDLVAPVSYHAGRRYPLIVVQYSSRGFLRGGTGDEFPIQAFAARGYFVLSYQRPDWESGLSGGDTIARERTALRDFRVRRINQEALEREIGQLIADGRVDGARIGLTGLSEGSTMVQFAGLHNRLFRAAAVSGCCWDEGQDAILGPSVARLYHQAGWPPLTTTRPRFWREISWVSRSSDVAFPVLMQAADREYLAALPSYTALRQSGKPAALYVFPDEQHIKWQPAHRLAAYSRVLAWFDFWLKKPADRQPEDAAFFADWVALRPDKPLASRPLRPSVTAKPRYRAAP